MLRLKSLLPIIFAVLVFIPFETSAAGVEVGKIIPHTLSVKDQNGEDQSFKSVTGEKGAVLVFVRSVDWCQYCQAQLLDLSEKAEDIEALGFSLVTISYDSVEKLKRFTTKYTFPHTMLSDERSEIIRAFDILNEDFPKGTAYYGVPNPAIYVVNADGIVKKMLQHEGFKTRPSVEKIVAAIKE